MVLLQSREELEVLGHQLVAWVVSGLPLRLEGIWGVSEPPLLRRGAWVASVLLQPVAWEGLGLLQLAAWVVTGGLPLVEWVDLVPQRPSKVRVIFPRKTFK